MDKGDAGLLEVFFESNKEVISFCEQLFYYNKRIELHWKTNEKWGNQLIIKNCTSITDNDESITKSMVDVFIEHRLNKMIREVIEKKYYYSNLEEIERILDITYCMVTGNDYQSMLLDKDPKGLLYSLFKANIEHAESIHFDSIINFRFNIFKENLIHFVGLAIDEFKREEEHQTFINMLREYVTNKDSIYPTIYILQGTSFLFFKPDGEKFSKMELKKLMKQEPLYIVGLDENEWNLAPLIAMAPNSINIYGDYPSEPKTLTIINIFQEKVKFKPYNKFPFTNHFKKM